MNRRYRDFHSDHLERQVSLSFYHGPAADRPTVDHLVIINDGQELAHMDIGHIVKDRADHHRRSVLVVGCAAAPGEARKQEYGVQWSSDYAGRGRLAAAYNQFILSELIPFLHQEYSLDQSTDTTMAGWSLGGLSALDIAWHSPHRFRKTGVFSGSFWWRHPEKIKDDVHHRMMHHRIRNTSSRPELKFWFQAGTEDEIADRNNNGVIDVIDDTLDLISELNEKGYHREHDMKFHIVEGGRHDLPTWKKMMPVFLDWVITGK